MNEQESQSEVKLKRLVESNFPENRFFWAKEWKRHGGSVVGVLCTYVPAEILVAAGIMPYRVSGKWSSQNQQALAMRSTNSSSYCNHLLQSLLDGDFDFLDGVVGTTIEQDFTRLWDLWVHLGKTKFNQIIHLPDHVSARTVKHFRGELSRLQTEIQSFTGMVISEEQLRQASVQLNLSRSLMLDVYQLRKKPSPPLTGAEMLGLAVASTLMPPELFNAELEELLPYLQQRHAPLTSTRPRLLVSGDYLDNLEQIKLIESLGCVVAMDDLDLGIRYYQGLVNLDMDPLTAIAERYMNRIGSARMIPWDAQVKQVVQWAREYDIDGVVDLTQRYSRAREIRRPFFLEGLRQNGIKTYGCETEYVLSHSEQFKTRIQAFLETLD